MGLICGIPPIWYQFNGIVHSVGLDGVFWCPGSPPWLKGNDGPVEVQGGGALVAVLFCLGCYGQGLYHLAGPPSTPTWGEAHFATRMGLSVAEGEHKVHRGASSSPWWRLVEEGKLFSLDWLPTSPSCWLKKNQKPKRTKVEWKIFVFNIRQMSTSCKTCIASLIY